MLGSSTDPADLIVRWRAGDATALDRLLPMIYADLRRMAARRLDAERDGATMQPTALVHDVFIRLLSTENLEVENVAHLLNLAGRVMRRILVDRARHADAQKHGGQWERAELAEALNLPIPERTDLGLLDEAINQLERIDERMARVVELRYFVGLGNNAIAQIMGVDKRTVYRDWAFAKAWLRTNMER